MIFFSYKYIFSDLWGTTHVDPSRFLFWGGGGGGSAWLQMALSYYLSKLCKDCFLKHNGWNDSESAVQDSSNDSKRQMRAESALKLVTRWLFMNGGENLRLQVLS